MSPFQISPAVEQTAKGAVWQPAHHDDFLDGEGEHHVCFLRNKRYASCNLDRSQAGQRLTAKPGRSTAFRDEAGENFQQGRFTGSVWAEQNNEFARRDIKRNIAQHWHRRVAEAEAMQVKDGHKNWFYISNPLQYRIESAI